MLEAPDKRWYKKTTVWHGKFLKRVHLNFDGVVTVRARAERVAHSRHDTAAFLDDLPSFDDDDRHKHEWRQSEENRQDYFSGAASRLARTSVRLAPAARFDLIVGQRSESVTF